MVALALGLLALASGAATGEALSEAKHVDPLALATQVDSTISNQSAPRHSLIQDARGFFSKVSLDVAEAPRRDVPFSSDSTLSGTAPAFEVQLSAATPFNLDVGVARRQVSSQQASQFTEGSGAEVRLGKNLARLAPEFQNPGAGETAWYLFAASDGRALTWNPSSDPGDPNRNLRVQDRAEIGEGQVGVTMQKKSVQASLALVQRTVKSRIGPYKESKDESFAGLTLTWKR